MKKLLMFLAVISIAAQGIAAESQWKEKLGLDAEQSSKFIAANDAREGDLRSLHYQLKAGMSTLRNQLAGGAPEPAIEESLSRISRIRKAVADRDERFEGAIALFLSPSQRAKLLVWRSLAASRLKSVKAPEPSELLESNAGTEPEPE